MIYSTEAGIVKEVACESGRKALPKLNDPERISTFTYIHTHMHSCSTFKRSEQAELDKRPTQNMNNFVFSLTLEFLFQFTAFGCLPVLKFLARPFSQQKVQKPGQR